MSTPHLDSDQHLMMAALDGELDATDRQQLDRRLAEDPALATEWQRLTTLKEMTAMTQIATPPDHLWTGYWQSIFRRLERGIAWLLLSLGAGVLAGWGVWQGVNELLADTSTPIFIKLALFALGLGAVLLLISVGREKFFTHRHDPYKEIER